jgi:uncharacterized Zn finger protein (UPF0148 family)
MSEDFDKEAEREKLREKYGDEDAQREATQHMSELLLKGATMTNQHCPNCGDPIFRHDGRTFCPTCNQDGDASAADTNADRTADANTDTTADAPTDGTADATANGKANASPTGGDPDRQRAGSDSSGRGETTQPVSEAGGDERRTIDVSSDAADDGDAAASGSSRRPRTTPGGDPADTDARAPSNVDAPDAVDPVAVDGDAVAAVETTLERFATAAARTDDAERAQECLAVVRDAAATLRSLRSE